MNVGQLLRALEHINKDAMVLIPVCGTAATVEAGKVEAVAVTWQGNWYLPTRYGQGAVVISESGLDVRP